jgi:T-complex protein 1 subunit eta
VARVKELAVDIGGASAEEKKRMLQKCAQTSLNSKLVGGRKATAAC